MRSVRRLVLACVGVMLLSWLPVSPASAHYGWWLETGEGPTPPSEHFDGAPAEYASSWAAKELCTRVFVAGGDPQPTMNNELRLASALSPGFSADLSDIDIDHSRRMVTVHQRGYPPRSAVQAGSHGCTVLTPFSGRLHFEPRDITWQGPSADEPWPLGENLWHGASDIDRQRLEATLDAHMALPTIGTHEAGARAVAVVHEGELVGERYKDGYGRYTPQRAWSINKSLTSTLVGLMADRGLLALDTPVPVLDWQGDERRNITLRNMLNMSSGLDQVDLTGDPQMTFTPENQHSFVYFEGFNVVKDAIEHPARRPPDEAFEYRNANFLIAAALAREAARHAGDDPDTLLHREVFERLGMRSSVQENDPYGNHISTGTFYTTARDLARLGLLHLNEGTYAGERVLSKGWVDFIRAPSPASAGYGGGWWLGPGGERFCEIPDDAYAASGAFGQSILVIPSYDLVITRLGVNFVDPVGVLDQLACGVMEAVDAGEGGGPL